MLSGGVCAVLDYEVDQMTDYVAEMAQRIVRPGSPVSPPFRKFVSGLLSSTRLPSTTILLGMNYLARRVNMLNAVSTFSANEGQVWRLLTIGLLLGSKFLDDNTFQNRSWSEVSGISVAELNKMEAEWLVGIGWSLYVNLDESKDFKAWLQSWSDWRATKNLERSATLERLAPLTPIDTNVQRPRPYSQAFNGYAKSTSRECPQPGFMAPYEQTAWVNNYPTPHLTPPSAPDSGLNTPEYLSATGGGPRYNDWALFNQYSRGYQPQAHATYVPTRVAAYHTPYTPYTPHYNTHYGGNIWDPNVVDCNCNACSPHTKQQPYFMGHAYGGQLVVG